MSLMMPFRAMLLLAAVLLTACGGGATSEGIGPPGGGGGAASGNANLLALTLECETPEAICANIQLVVPSELNLAPPPPGFQLNTILPDGVQLNDYTSVQSALVAGIRITPTAINAGATIQVNGVVVPSGQPTDAIPLAVGDTEIVVLVTSENQLSTRTYTIAVTRLSPDNADLSSLRVTGGTLSPAFRSDTTEYTSIAQFGVGGAIGITAVSVEPSARIRINGVEVVSGSASDPIPLVVGVNDPIEVAVTALNGGEKTYRITVTQLGSANLVSLSVTGLTEDIPPQEVLITSTPAFASNVGLYGIRVENRVVALRITPTAAAPGAVIRIGDEEIASGADSEPVPLVNIGEGAENNNPVEIVVTHDASGEDEPFLRTYTLNVTRQEPPLFAPEAYLKPSLEGAGWQYGTSIALSADGNTAVVGAPGAEGGRGIASVYARNGAGWVEQASIPGTVANGAFGHSVALSPDGQYLVVGAPNTSRVVDGEVIAGFGSAYVYGRDNATWQSLTLLEPFNPGEDYRYGEAVAIAVDAGVLTIAVGAPAESSGDGGVHQAPLAPGAHEDRDAIGSGAVYVYTCPAGAEPPCSLQAFIKSPAPVSSLQNQSVAERFGEVIALAADGNVLAVGMPGDSSNATGIDGEATAKLFASGGAYVYRRDAAVWDQQPVHFKASVLRANYQFGAAIALSGDGATLAIGTPLHDGDYSGVGVPEGLPISAVNSGGAHIFVHDGTSWSRQVFIKPSNTRAGYQFGTSLALSQSGDALVVGAPGETSRATTIDGNELLDGAIRSGAAYVFRREVVMVDEAEQAAWTQIAFIKAANSRAENNLGVSSAISADGAAIALGAPGERSAETGIDLELPYADDTVAANRGAAYLFIAVEPEAGEGTP